MGCITLCFLVRFAYYHGFSLQFTCLARVLRGVTIIRGMFLGIALNGMRLKELLAALGHSNLLNDLQI